jgi:chemotaxis protein histidine kinase CheA
MRLALTVSLAALLSCSIVQADDETTAAAPAAAASPAAESSAAPAAEATPATSAVPAAQPQASEPARQADAANAPAAKAAEAPAAPAMTKEQEQKAFNERMKRQGYQLTTLSGQTVYCKGDQHQMGTRLGRKQMCWTADQIRAREDDVQTVREKQGQTETSGR